MGFTHKHNLSLPTKNTIKTSTSMVMTIATDDEKKFRILGNGSGIRSIIDDYDVFLLDMWGVMHDGNQPYSGVQEVVKKLKSYNSNINDNNNDNVGGQKKKKKKKKKKKMGGQKKKKKKKKKS